MECFVYLAHKPKNLLFPDMPITSLASKDRKRKDSFILVQEAERKSVL
jgi:hypothetical protein